MWVTVAIVVVLVALVWRYTGRPKGLLPGSTCYPIIRNVGLVKPSEAVQAHRKLKQKYGDIYTIMTFHKPMIAVHGYDNIRELLVKYGGIFSDRPLTIVNGVFNTGKRFDLVIRSLMGRTESVCSDNNENIWVWKTLLTRSNHGRSGLSNERTRDI